MESLQQEIFKAENGKLFFTKEECVVYETRVSNGKKRLTFLLNEGFRYTISNGPSVERYDGKFTILGFDSTHIYIEKIRG